MSLFIVLPTYLEGKAILFILVVLVLLGGAAASPDKMVRAINRLLDGFFLLIFPIQNKLGCYMLAINSLWVDPRR